MHYPEFLASWLKWKKIQCYVHCLRQGPGSCLGTWGAQESGWHLVPPHAPVRGADSMWAQAAGRRGELGWKMERRKRNWLFTGVSSTAVFSTVWLQKRGQTSWDGLGEGRSWHLPWIASPPEWNCFWQVLLSQYLEAKIVGKLPERWILQAAEILLLIN